MAEVIIIYSSCQFPTKNWLHEYLLYLWLRSSIIDQIQAALRVRCSWPNLF